MKSGEQGNTANQNPVGVQCEDQDAPSQSITFDGNLAQDARATPLLVARRRRGATKLPGLRPFRMPWLRPESPERAKYPSDGWSPSTTSPQQPSPEGAQ